MAPKKKSKKKSTGSKKSNHVKSSAKPPAKKRKAPKKLAKRKALPNKSAARKKAPAKAPAKKTQLVKRQSGASKKRRTSRQPGPSLSPESSGLQSGDMQGLSNVESVDSESVDELLEEGNAFEAGIVSGVEDSAGREGKEVRTREVPEDDVPGEYLDED
jgi:hypothetical protein